jgi:hypothetical protein
MWYVFTNIMAESWCDETWEHINELSLKEASAVFDTKGEVYRGEARDKAYQCAVELDSQCGQFGEGTEYGVHTRLFKDDKRVRIIK